MSLYSSLQGTFLIRFIRWLYQVRIVGDENEPTDKNFIVCANHTTMWDPFIVGACLKAPVRNMAKKELFRIPLIKQVVTALGAYPVDRKSSDASAIKKTIQMLEQGEVISIFPQGRRYKGIDPRLSEVKNGVAMIAQRAKVGILPVTLTFKNYRPRILRKTVVTIGRFIPYEDLDFSGGYAPVSDLVLRRICDGLEDGKNC